MTFFEDLGEGWKKLLWDSITAIENGEVLWNCGCVSPAVNGIDPVQLTRIMVTCKLHRDLWTYFGIQVEKEGTNDQEEG